MPILPKPKIPPLIRRSLLVGALSVAGGCGDDGPAVLDAGPDAMIIAPQPPPQPPPPDAMPPDASIDAATDASNPPPPQPPPPDAMPGG